MRETPPRRGSFVSLDPILDYDSRADVSGAIRFVETDNARPSSRAFLDEVAIYAQAARELCPMRKLIKTLLGLAVLVGGLAWEFPVRALRLLEETLMFLHMPVIAAEIQQWFLLHPNLANEIGPWVLIFAGTASLLAIHLGPWASRHLNPLEFYLEPDIGTGALGAQSFPGGPTILQVRVRTKLNLARCRANILRIAYKASGGSYDDERNEHFPCQWSWPGTEERYVIDLTTAVPGVFNLATVAGSVLHLEPQMPTNLLPLLQRVGTHRFTVNVTGYYHEREKHLTNDVYLRWHGSQAPASLSFEAT
jgi:hypothetical protein